MDKPARWRRLAIPLAVAAFSLLLSVPLILRASHPSIYADDVVRIGDLRETRSILQQLFAPFNEHMAPLFQAVTFATWQLAGQSLVHAPLAFTLSAFLPHVLCILMLGAIIRRETGSLSTALVMVPLFGLSGLISESFSWYSASSFSWALLGTLIAIECAGRAAREGVGHPRIWLACSATAALAAPAFSAIGLLAGPLACIRLGLTSRLRLVVPLIGTFGYLALCLPFRYHAIVSHSVQRNLDLGAVARNVACTPVEVLLPGILGRHAQITAVPDPVAIALSLAILVTVLVWAWKDRSSRTMIWLAVAMLVGGFGLAFAFRSADTSESLRTVQRYQLFPQVGLVLLVAAAARRFISRFDHSLLQSWSVGVVFTAIVLCLQMGLIREHARFYRWPDQARTLAAIERLAETCEREGISRKQCLAVLDPVRNRWFDFGFNALMMLPQASWSQHITDSEARELLLTGLDRNDRESLFGGMDVSHHFIAAESFRPNGLPAVPTLVRSFEMSQSDRPDSWVARGWASYLEYEFPANATDDALAISLPVNGPVELWWSSDGHNWSEAHSVRWRADKSDRPIEHVVFLSHLPHWNPEEVRRVRIAPRDAGALAIGSPKLLR